MVATVSFTAFSGTAKADEIATHISLIIASLHFFEDIAFTYRQPKQRQRHIPARPVGTTANPMATLDPIKPSRRCA
jgi:hypothetical protein